MLELGINSIYNSPAFEIDFNDPQYPDYLKLVDNPPKKLYLVGNPASLIPGIAVIGARKATPYGITCAKHFASIAAKYGINIISGGAYGCDSAAHRAALSANSKTVVFLGGGCNRVYPQKNLKLYKQIIAANGAIVSEHPWDYNPLPYTFLQRNRLIAGLSKVLLICEAGLPSGTFSTADWAIKYGKELWAVPGSITFEGSSGCNKLIYDGATPIINTSVFLEELSGVFDEVLLKDVIERSKEFQKSAHKAGMYNPVIEAVLSQPTNIDELFDIAKNQTGVKEPAVWLSKILTEAETAGLISKYPNGTYGPKIK